MLKTAQLPYVLAMEHIPQNHLAVLSGPSFAKDLALKHHIAIMLGSKNKNNPTKNKRCTERKTFSHSPNR